MPYCDTCGFRMNGSNPTCNECMREHKGGNFDEEAHKRVIEMFGHDTVRLKTVPTDLYLDMYTYWEMIRNEM